MENDDDIGVQCEDNYSARKSGGIMKYPREEFYSCYSPKLKEYLEQFGFEPCDVFTHIKTNKICWVYEKDEKLAPYLQSWTANKSL